MEKIGIVGSKDYFSQRKVAEFIRKIHSQFGPTAIIMSGGNDQGAERWAKKYALEFNMQYQEYNPSFTGQRMYSAMPESYFGKGFHPSHFYDRYRILLNNVDKLIIFVHQSGKLESDLEYLHKNAIKRGIPHTIIK